MKIGILTLRPSNNYGGILQLYALMTLLKQMGHTPIVLDRYVDYSPSNYQTILYVSKRFIKKYILKNASIKKIYTHTTDREQTIISQNTQRFIRNHLIPISPVCYSSSQLNKISQSLDAIVIGSDQVWRKAYIKDAYSDFFSGFLERSEIRSIAYAASFGVDKWEYSTKETKKITQCGKFFSAISVREETGISLCEKFTSLKPELVLDPTLLIDKNLYINLGNKSPRQNGNMLLYILDFTIEKEEIVNRFSQIYSTFSVFVKSKLEDAPIEDRIYPPVENWIRGFMDAEFVFTDSFHGCVFSILFNKPFIAYANEGRGKTRVECLLKLFNLSDRLLNSLDEFDISIMERQIDWESVNRKHDLLKKQSILFLEKELKK